MPNHRVSTASMLRKGTALVNSTASVDPMVVTKKECVNRIC